MYLKIYCSSLFMAFFPNINFIWTCIWVSDLIIKKWIYIWKLLFHTTTYETVGSSDVQIFGPRALPCSLYTPHPLESHIERKPPHLLPYKLWSQGRVLVVHYSLGFIAYKAANGGIFFRCGTLKDAVYKDYKAKPLVRRFVHPRILQ